MSIAVISYPSGGFGNFLYFALTKFADRTVKIYNPNFEFSANGNSHTTPKYTRSWLKDPDNYTIGFDCPEDKIALVLCDNGINNDRYDKLRLFFKDFTIVRVNIDYNARPVIYQTCVTKAMQTDIESENIENVIHSWNSNEPYAIRENYTLFYHNWPFKWESDPTTLNVSLEKLITQPADTIRWVISQLGCNTINNDDLDDMCASWLLKNQQYFEIYYQWNEIEFALRSGRNLDLTHIKDLHTQGYVNYRIEKMFNCTIPVYDFRDWFGNTQQILDNFT